MAGYLLAITLVMAASLMYLAENEAQPVAFANIPAAMWWGLVTLTTVGYGDVTPVTSIGKVLFANKKLIYLLVFHKYPQKKTENPIKTGFFEQKNTSL